MRADHQQVGTVDPGHQQRRPGRRLAQVPVDREAVVGVALGPASARFPFGDDHGEQAPVVEALDDGDHRRTASQQLDEPAAQIVRPRVGEGDTGTGELLERAPGDADLVVGRGECHVEQLRRRHAMVGRDPAVEMDLTVTHGDPVADAPLTGPAPEP
jgi:hypothetical protein